MRYSVGIIGLGMIGAKYDLEDPDYEEPLTHLSSFYRNQNFKLEFIHDKSEKIKDLIKNKYHDINFVQFLEDASPGTEIIVIATEASGRYKLVKKILSIFSPRVILIEKPVANSIDETLKIFNICNKKKINVLINFPRSHHPETKAIKRIISQRKPSCVTGYLSLTGDIFHNGIHFLDLINTLLGKVSNIIKHDTHYELILNNGTIIFKHLSSNFKYSNFSGKFFFDDFSVSFPSNSKNQFYDISKSTSSLAYKGYIELKYENFNKPFVSRRQGDVVDSLVNFLNNGDNENFISSEEYINLVSLFLDVLDDKE